ncbi:Uncharacterized conserved protein [Bradyrhizobium sp. NFR13]|jgi:hypothetical protein|uniref:COG4223 family protein n=1 Tax=Bradyrhizobium sp. NFR13 TaxID=1566285 RepID=UPI0008EE6384|nr:hypothetical protein [Bradyrhizobium sp. NFR13]SFL41753.1 Uncharacterized conserved protein [Bradyrhizobium sp. NFR13]
MADDSDTGSSPDAGRPKRPPPTIELTAADVTERPAAAESAAPETPSESVDTAPSDMPPFEPAGEAAAEKSASASPARAPVLVGAAMGAVAGALAAGIAWFGLSGSASSDKADVDALASRIAQIEARPAVAPDTGLVIRIDTLEKSIAGLRGDLAAAKTQSDRVVADLNQLKSAPRPAAGVVDLGPINERLGQIERAASELKSSAAQQNTKPVDDAALRRVVAASLLDTSVRQSEPYAAALAAVKPLASNANQLKPLDAFAATGVPNAAALSRELLVLLPKLTPAPAETPAAGAGFMDRLQAGAARLVRLERTDVSGAGNNSSTISRVAVAARSNDVTTAKRELLTLSAADRAPVQPWLDKVDARDAALAASRQFAADAMAALSKPAP